MKTKLNQVWHAYPCKNVTITVPSSQVRKTACCARLWLCMSLIRGEVDCGYRFRRLFVPLLFPHFYHAIRSRSTISICIYILLLVWACCCLIAISSFIFHTFHGTGRLILTYSNNYLYVRVAGNIPCILTQGAIQFCSSTFFSCFVQPSVLTAYRLLSRTIIVMIPFKLT